MKDQNNKLSLVFIALLLVALAGAVAIIGKSTETRRGAYFAGGKILLSSSEGEVIEKQLGEDLSIPVYVETDTVTNGDELTKVDFVQTKVCYGDFVSLKNGEAAADLKKSIKVSEDFDLVVGAKLEEVTDSVDYKKCLTFSTKAERSVDELKTGMVHVVTIQFTTASVGEGKMDVDASKSTVSGPNPDNSSSDMAIKLGEVRGVGYRITRGNDPDKVVNLKVSFNSVKPTSECANVSSINVVAESGGVKKSYDVSLTKTGETNKDGDVVYEGSLTLKEFAPSSKVAFLIKADKYLRLKYGKDGQNGYYNDQDGQIEIISGKTYNFSDYPLLSGDVDVNGNVSGTDFEMIKTKAKSFVEGSSMPEDLDGSCQINTVDLVLLAESLQINYDQAY